MRETGAVGRIQILSNWLAKHETLGTIPFTVNIVAIPKSERQGLHEHLMFGTGEVWTAVRQFSHALSLFDFCLSQSAHEDWKLIAARDGAWSIYNFGLAIREFRANMKGLPTLQKSIDKAKIRAAFREFENTFPDYEAIRNALGHFTETNSNEKHRAEHSYDGHFESDGMRIVGESKGTLIKQSFKGRTFQTTREGRLLKYEVSADTLQRLVSIKELFYSALLPFVAETWSHPAIE